MIKWILSKLRRRKPDPLEQPKETARKVLDLSEEIQDLFKEQEEDPTYRLKLEARVELCWRCRGKGYLNHDFTPNPIVSQCWECGGAGIVYS